MMNYSAGGERRQGVNGRGPMLHGSEEMERCRVAANALDLPASAA
jgi:hypothetical protein